MRNIYYQMHNRELVHIIFIMLIYYTNIGVVAFSMEFPQSPLSP
jgi:hypothetical protein